MDEARIIEQIKTYLIDFDIVEYDYLKDATQQQLIAIEKYFNDCEQSIQKAMEVIKNTNLTLRGISKGSGVGKSTIYNNPNTLKAYIEKRINIIETSNILSQHNTSKYEAQNNEIKELLDKMVIDIVKYNNIEVENEILHKQVDEFRNRIDVMHEERIILINQMSQMEMELKALRKKGNNIVDFKMLD